MKKVFISPHYDDAVCSCAGSIIGMKKMGDEIIIVTVFADQYSLPLNDFALALHKQWGVIDGVKERNIENTKACNALGINYVNLAFSDAIYRKQNNDFLYGKNEDLFDGIIKDDQSLSDRIENDIINLFSREECEIFFPNAKGGHVDHVIVFNIGINLVKCGYNITFYDEFYYENKVINKNFVNQEVYFGLDIMDKKVSVVMCYASQLKIVIWRKWTKTRNI